MREDHRYAFTLIHKYHTEPGQQYPVLSERDDIIVMTDDAHRSQYDILAQLQQLIDAYNAGRLDVDLFFEKLVVLDSQLPPAYDAARYEEKCRQIYDHIYQNYYGAGQSVYAQA